MDQKINPNDNIIDFREFLYKVINNWFYFLLSIVLALIIAFGYTRYSHELYKSSTKVMINKADNNVSAADMMYKSISGKRFTQYNIRINPINIYTYTPV